MERRLSLTVDELWGYDFRGVPSTGDKVSRATPVSAAAYNRTIYIVRGAWNNAFFDELESFDPRNNNLHDDQVDALSGAFAYLTSNRVSALFGWGD